MSPSESHVRTGRQSRLTISDRFCIKIPTTSAGVQAAAQLYEEGIRTLGTALFSLAQALAAAQAKMLSISPYFNGGQSQVPTRPR